MPPNLQPSVPDGEPNWARSSLSFQDGHCVEVAIIPGDDGGVMMRHSKNPGPVLMFTHAEWDAFLGGVRNGEFGGFAQ